MNPCCDLDLENSKPIFLHAFQLIIMHHNTMFGNKMFRSSENTIWTNMYILALCCDLDLECSNPFSHKTLWLMMVYHRTKFGCQGINRLEDIVGRVIF